MKAIFVRMLLVLMVVILVGCAGGGAVELAPDPESISDEEGGVKTPDVETEATQSERVRIVDPGTDPEDQVALAVGNSNFSLDLYQQLSQQEGNLFFSPYSISLALAMVYAGARGTTESQMAKTLHFTLSQDQLHAAFNALDQEITSRSQGNEDYGDPGFQLNTANSIWGQKGFAFEEMFLDVLAENYGAGLRMADFQKNPESARQIINDWVSQQTMEKIQDLISPGSIDSMTRMVLANAIYFYAAWANEFNENLTEEAPFYLLDGKEVIIPMMNQEQSFPYLRGEGYQVVELPYTGSKLSMLIVVPDSGSYEAVESSMDVGQMTEIVDLLSHQEVQLGIPKFTFESKYTLTDTLSVMGMDEAMNPSSADFSGMDTTQELFIGAVVHKAFVAVDEKGTEAAAATAVEMAATSMEEEEQPIELTIDRPFIFIIRDRPSNTILFMGRVVDP
jgi:serpin B